MTAGVAVSRASSSTRIAYGGRRGVADGRPAAAAGHRERRAAKVTPKAYAVRRGGGGGGTQQLGNRGRAHGGGARRGGLPRLPGFGRRAGHLAKHAGALPTGRPPAPPKEKAEPETVPAQSGDRRAGRLLGERGPRVAGRRSGQGAAHLQGHAEHGRPGARHLQGRLPDGQVQGTDGVPIEHVVRFTRSAGYTWGSARRRTGRPRRGRRSGPGVSGSRGRRQGAVGVRDDRTARSSSSPDRCHPLTGGRDDRAAPQRWSRRSPAVVSSPDGAQGGVETACLPRRRTPADRSSTAATAPVRPRAPAAGATAAVRHVLKPAWMLPGRSGGRRG